MWIFLVLKGVFGEENTICQSLEGPLFGMCTSEYIA